ncbi:MAG: S9 family peptidase [Chloroflexota bacterium]
MDTSQRKQQTLTSEDLLQLQFLQSAVLSPDGQWIVSELSAYDADEEMDYQHLWLHNIENGKARQLTYGKHNNSQPAWSPDGQTIAFVSTRNNKPQLYVLPVDGGEARSLTNFVQGIGGEAAWAPDGTQIAFTVPKPPPNGEAERDDSLPYRVTRHVYRFDAVGNLDDAANDIYVIKSDGTGDAQPLTDDTYVNSRPQWSPDGRELLYSAAMPPDQFNVYFQEICIITLGENEKWTTRTLYQGWGDKLGPVWGPVDVDGNAQILFVGTPVGKPIGSKSDLYIASASGEGVPENRTLNLTVGVAGHLLPDMPSRIMAAMETCVAKDGKSAFIQVQIGGTIQIYRIALVGEESCEAVVDGTRACVLLDSQADQLLYAVSGFNDTPDLYIKSLENNQKDGQEARDEQRITSVNDAYLAQFGRMDTEHLTFAGADGTLVEGWFLSPPTGEAPYPTILYIHGGPHSAYGHMYHNDTQMLTGAGYAVLMVNHRASIGYGDDFSTAIKGDWGNLDYTDLMAGVDEAIARGLADPGQMGVCGLSGGGNLSCWIVGQTGRFKAAVPENPVTNWQSFYGTSDIGVWFSVEQLGGHPHEIPEIYDRCSPITYAHRCTTPTLMIQGEADWRCPAEQSEQFYTVLKANDCPVEMLRIPGGAHGGTRRGTIAMRRAQDEALLGWMNQWVKS